MGRRLSEEFLKLRVLCLSKSVTKKTVTCLSQSEAAFRHIKAAKLSKEGCRKAIECFLEKQHCGGTVYDGEYREEASEFFIS